jgi:catechol 2,3-dioxygenase-like lactoylglutathione lyase family enzyme
MGIRRLEHCNILTPKYAETLTFYADVLGMKIGPSPANDIKESAWIYDGAGTAVVHVQRVDPANPEHRFGMVKKRLGDLVGPLEMSQLKGGGAIEHIAFECDDYDETAAMLSKAKIAFARNGSSAGFRQLFLNDPNGVTLELNFR